MAKSDLYAKGIALALLHMSRYVGVPLIREALLTASRMFKEMRNEETSASERLS
jgi:hypothetical protein